MALQRASGVLLHISSLYGDYSSGSFGEAAIEFIDFLVECGFTYWQVLPFCVTEECNSPYKSYGAFSGNPFFVDLPTLYKEGLLTKEELDSARQKTPYYCEFDVLQASRMSLLKKAKDRFTDNEALDAFFDKNPHIASFCRFMALKKANHGAALNERTVDFPDAQEEALWRFVEYQFFKQWKKIKEYANEKGIRIIGDIPIYVSLDSSDVEENKSDFLVGDDYAPSSVAGVPPDYFSEDGQLWGNPLYDWEHMEQNDFSWWRDRLAFENMLFDGIRIDHFRGIESYYSIPATEATAKNGKWVKGPGMKFVKVIREMCRDKLVIAEDLGDITPAVYELLRESGLPGMRVLQFAFLGDNDSPHRPHNYVNNCVAYTGTHDNNTLLGYVWELDDATRKELLEYFGYTGANWDACYDTILRGMFASSAGLLILPIQDLLLYGSDTRFNKPGTTEDNWNYRITKEQLLSIDRKKFRRWNQLYARIPSAN
ncbi:MAG: 4-alpha-glucanotransferase [Clostridia bacterium]|nr:4-alpha-glucanotransferase [Clostridia bacterium]